jgi:hypothetical protein
MIATLVVYWLATFAPRPCGIAAPAVARRSGAGRTGGRVRGWRLAGEAASAAVLGVILAAPLVTLHEQ